MACHDQSYAIPCRRYRPAITAFPPAQCMRVAAYKALDAITMTRRPTRTARSSSGMECPPDRKLRVHLKLGAALVPKARPRSLLSPVPKPPLEVRLPLPPSIVTFRRHQSHCRTNSVFCGGDATPQKKKGCRGRGSPYARTSYWLSGNWETGTSSARSNLCRAAPFRRTEKMRDGGGRVTGGLGGLSPASPSGDGPKTETSSRKTTTGNKFEFQTWKIKSSCEYVIARSHSHSIADIAGD